MEWELYAAGTPIVVRAGRSATVGGLRKALRDMGFGGPALVCPDDTPLAEAGLLPGRDLARHTATDQDPGTCQAKHADRPQDCASCQAKPGGIGGGRAEVWEEVWEVAAVGGPGCGARATTPPGATVTIGRSARCALRLRDPEVSRTHATLHLHDGRATVTDAGSRNLLVHNGFTTAELTVGELDAFGLGETVVTVRRVDPADAPIEQRDGALRYNRPPRILPPVETVELRAPTRPQEPRGVRIPLLAALLPLLLGGLIWALFPAAGIFIVIFLALSPLLLLANYVSDKRSGRREYRQAVREYEQQQRDVAARLKALVAVQGRKGRVDEPDPALVKHIATAPTRRLFERRPDDPDFLRVRIGLGPRPPHGRFHELDVPQIPWAPICLELAQLGVAGLAGVDPRAALAQLAVLHAPHDVGIVILTGQDRATQWEWASWLPHTVPHSPDFACRRLIATDAEQATARIAELKRLIDERLADRRSTLRHSAPAGRRMVVVLDGARRLRALPGLADVLAQGPEAGVYALCLDSSEQNLPDECRATVLLSGTRGSLTESGRSREDGVLLDHLTADDARIIALALAPLRVLGGVGGSAAGLPDTVRFLDISPRWQADRRGVRAFLGMAEHGPLEIDLRRDGPHALIAGTTGAGKSELLQTLVASLALNNPPEAVNFVLVDYKGGSAFAECRNLPHTVGMVTDLDGHLVKRALASLSAELRRRETLLAEAAAKDIDDYLARGHALARLVIVIDEFASLLEEVPEFVSGIVGIGNRGRSLGVHIVLATQRPGGKVGADLRANLNLRICLRVASPDESSDVIEVPDAARLSRHRPGRGYVKAGHGDLTAFQAARVAWPRGDGQDPELVEVRLRRVTDLGRGRVASTDDGGHAGDTDLTVLVDAIRATGAQRPPSPWLAPLPESVVLDHGIGLLDEPSAQRQVAYALDLAKTGPIVVAGMARSGRSTALRTIAAELAERHSPADLHLYILDYGGGALAGLAGLPHCGAYADEPDRTARVLSFLDSSLPSQGVLLIDGYEAFTARFADVDNGRLVELVAGLLRSRVRVVLATDRTAFGHRLANAIETRIVLRHADRDELSAYGLNPREAPLEMPPGRAVLAPSGLEMQLAQREPDVPALIRRWRGLDRSVLPHRIDPLPTAITRVELELLRDRPLAPGWATIGCGGDHLAPIDVELAQPFLIAGPPGTGRSTALLAIAESLAGDYQRVVLCPRSSPLRELESVDLADASGRIALFVDDAELLGDADHLEEFVRGTRDNGHVLVVAGTTDDLQAHRYRGWLNLVRRNRFGLLLSPASRIDGELFELQLPRSTNGEGWPPGRGLLVAGGAVRATIQVMAK